MPFFSSYVHVCTCMFIVSINVYNVFLFLSFFSLSGEVNRLQSVVQSAMETYVSSPVVANSSTRSSLSLSDDPLPSTFARELLQ